MEQGHSQTQRVGVEQGKRLEAKHPNRGRYREGGIRRAATAVCLTLGSRVVLAVTRGEAGRYAKSGMWRRAKRKRKKEKQRKLGMQREEMGKAKKHSGP